MSVATDITALTTKLSTIFDQIKTALAAKGVTGAPADYAAVPAKINAIVTGTGIDTSDATAEAGDIRSGKTAYVDGSKITGSLNLTARDSDDLYVTNNKVTAPAGLYAANASKTIATATHNKPSIQVNASTGVITASHTQSTGYVSNDTKSETYNLGTQAAATWTPTTTDQTIAQGKFLTGTQTIKGSANLVASNIKSGVNIFGVTGSYSGSGGSDPYTMSGTVSAYRTGAGAMTFSLPSNDTVAGFYMECPSAASGTIERLFVLGQASNQSPIVICVRSGYSAAGMYYQNGIVEYTVNNGYAAVTVDNTITGGFSSGQYTIKPFFF